MEWCRKHQDKSIEYWEDVLFTDETMVELNPLSTMNRVRRFRFENPNQKKYIAPKVKFTLKVIFWGGISTHFKTNLVACEGCMNSSKYIDTILKIEVAPRMKNKTNMIFQQDNAPCHTAKRVIEYFLIENIQKINWPPNSPDLNIIENVWNMMKYKLNRTEMRTRADLHTMPDGIKESIDVKGYNTSY